MDIILQNVEAKTLTAPREEVNREGLETKFSFDTSIKTFMNFTFPVSMFNILECFPSDECACF